ncbi:FAD-dependent tricarballylate dehydrogenase TcuA [Pseudonocardia kujensis]|uniref:FAD-dependent tricarballylate dehydrogenase TcuA n=1 Tax=Pseudonocardia kujensis TaxID=1128675 RepID=UPI001E60706F|nr:FAD-dependent tricarballylate dehydrogenase TcuA [Pseudonocardia kujensis]MCE0765589.1 FAD-dependent tricarballylate dehydrogenase TcuA [Pseudonocardia kujensis]
MSEVDAVDVIVVGAGNAGLLAALSARGAGCEVLLVEASDRAERGGNSRFASGVYRVAHAGAADLKDLVPDDQALPWDRMEIEPYPVERFLEEVVGPAQGFADPTLMTDVAAQSLNVVSWMRDHGVRWSLAMSKLPESLQAGQTVRLSPGGELIAEGNGLALVESLFARAEQLGVRIVYGSPVVDLVTSGRTITGVVLRHADRDETITAPVTILASGGFEASAEARLRYLGAGWDLVKVRGSRQNTGLLLDRAIAHGAGSAGHWSGAHAVPIDADAPPVGDLDVGDSTARYSYPYGITVDRTGVRFLDEGEDEMPFTYAEIGRKILGRPGASAYQVFDAAGTELLEPRYATAVPVEADTIEGLGRALGLPRLTDTVRDFNLACPGGRFDPSRLDGLVATPHGQPPKSNWARPLATPPFRAYRVTCGITFTFGGLAVDTSARVLAPDGQPIPGLLAAGEIGGGFFAFTVPSGSGLTRGAVHGRTAGRTAARLVSRL